MIAVSSCLDLLKTLHSIHLISHHLNDTD